MYVNKKYTDIFKIHTATKVCPPFIR